MGRGSKMAYRLNLRGAAKRHLRSADELYELTSTGSQPGCRAVAGYLFGLSAELALKEMMRASGMRPLPAERRRDDPFHAHFPDLKTLVLNGAQGRRAGEIKKIAETPAMFQNWNINMRYAPTEDIEPDWIESWRASAHELDKLMETA